MVNKIFHENCLLDAISSLIFPGDQERYNKILLSDTVAIGAKRAKIKFFFIEKNGNILIFFT